MIDDHTFVMMGLISGLALIGFMMLTAMGIELIVAIAREARYLLSIREGYILLPTVLFGLLFIGVALAGFIALLNVIGYMIGW